jgi:caffeoyl-CoA O-methyltransferase
VLPKLSPRGVIAVDNTLWSGRVLDPTDDSEDTVALRQFNDSLAVDPRVVVVQTTIRDGVTLVRRAG